MIRYFHKTTNSNRIEELDKYRKGSWIYAIKPKESEIQELVDELDLDKGHLDDAMDSDELPRLEREDDQIYLFTRFIMMDDNHLLTTTPLLLILHPECLITVSLDEIPNIDKLVESNDDPGLLDPIKLTLQLLNMIDLQFEEHLSDINKQIRATRTRLRVEEVRNQDFIDFVTIEDALDEFMTALTPMSSILKRLLVGRHVKFHTKDRESLEDLLLNNEQSLANCRSNIKSIINIREAYSTIMSNDLNRIIRILTVVTVIISVPTLISSVYGMNVLLPLGQNDIAFVILLVVSFVLSIALLWYFRFKRWL